MREKPIFPNEPIWLVSQNATTSVPCMRYSKNGGVTTVTLSRQTSKNRLARDPKSPGAPHSRPVRWRRRQVVVRSVLSRAFSNQARLRPALKPAGTVTNPLVRRGSPGARTEAGDAWGQRLMLPETGRKHCRGGVRGRIGTLQGANRRDSRRSRPTSGSFSLESSGSSGYDGVLRVDRWPMSGSTMRSQGSRRFQVSLDAMAKAGSGGLR